MFTIYDTALDSRFGTFDTYEEAATIAPQIVDEGFLDDYHIVNESGTREFWYHLDDYSYSQLYYWCGRLLLCGMGPDDDDGPTDLEILHGPQPA